jgi:hypothetical protein
MMIAAGVRSRTGEHAAPVFFEESAQDFAVPERRTSASR